MKRAIVVGLIPAIMLMVFLTGCPSAPTPKVVDQSNPPPAPVSGKSVDLKALEIDNGTNSLTKADIASLFDIPDSALQGDISTWQKYFNQQINNAYSKYHYLFVDISGNVTESAQGNVSVGADIKKIYVYFDMGLFKNVIYRNQNRKVGYLFRTIVELTTFGASVDVSSLFSIAASVKAKVSQGRIESTAAGLAGMALRKFLVPITSLGEDSIQKTIEGTAILNNKVIEGATDVFLSPVLYPLGD
jgi:hypothetical protein